MANPVPFLEDFEGILPGSGTGWLDRLRADAQKTYQMSGLPTPRTEAWKYTNLRQLARTDFVAAQASCSAEISVLPEGCAALTDAYIAAFVNGCFAPSLSSLDDLPEGVEAVSLAAKLNTDAVSLEGRFGDTDGLPLATLNTGLISDGLYLRLNDGVVLEKPIHLVSIGHSDGGPVSFHARHLIAMGAGTVATVVESHIGEGTYFSNGVLEISVNGGAVLNHYKLQNEGSEVFHVATNLVRLADGAVYDNFVLQVGAKLARNEIRAVLGERVECRLNGAYLAGGEQHIDNTTFIDHAAPNSSSREVYKGVLDESARGVFQGKILVRQGSQKTDGHQLNKTLLLSPGTEIDTKPELEIYADDVKCSHGATTGELEEEPLFYLRARGIDPERARAMLVAAFVGEALDEMQVEGPRVAFQALVDDWLARRSKGQE